jgi:hypothetical protein
MAVNRKAFQAVHELITLFPELHNQRAWERIPEYSGACGTTRCASGWAVWWKAKELGLLSQKRQHTDLDIREQVADAMGLDSAVCSSYSALGAAILGLDIHKADSLFSDFDDERVVTRVASYAATGHDLQADTED